MLFDEFTTRRRGYEFDAGESPAVDEQLLEREPIRVDPEIADPLEVTGQAGGPDPFAMHRRDEQLSLCDPGEQHADFKIL